MRVASQTPQYAESGGTGLPLSLPEPNDTDAAKPSIYASVSRPACRFQAVHDRHFKGALIRGGTRTVTRCRELMQINPLYLFFTGFIPPFTGALLSIIVALIFHNDEISNYNWQCGRARLPSLSRIINLSMERVFWHIAFLFHIPLRAIELSVGFVRYKRLRRVDCKYPRIYELSRWCYVIFGILELVFMVMLSVVGEREYIFYHVIFFYLYGIFALIFFVTNVICHASSIYYLNPYGVISYWTKIAVTVQYCISIPILFGSFMLYWRMCITFMYDIFAITEYLDVLFSIVYHSCAFWDIRHKVIFSIREVRTVKVR